MPVAIQNQSAVIDYIRRRLGYGVVDVELTDDHFDDCIGDALRLFNRYLMTMTNNVLRSQSGNVVVDLPNTVTGVYYLTFLLPDAEREVERMTIFEIIYRMAYPPMELGQWFMLKAFYEMYTRIRGTEPDWRYDPSEHKLYCDCWNGPFDIFYITSRDLTVDEILMGNRRKWAQEFLDLCVATAKEILAAIRGKFGNVPAPAGALVLNADKLAAEADAKRTVIEAKLTSMMKAYYLPQLG